MQNICLYQARKTIINLVLQNLLARSPSSEQLKLIIYSLHDQWTHRQNTYIFWITVHDLLTGIVHFFCRRLETVNLQIALRSKGLVQQILRNIMLKSLATSKFEQSLCNDRVSKSVRTRFPLRFCANWMSSLLCASFSTIKQNLFSSNACYIQLSRL